MPDLTIWNSYPFVNYIALPVIYAIAGKKSAIIFTKTKLNN